jgi:tricorn protease
MWWQGRVYFLSDRDGTMNLWSMTLAGGDLRQLTKLTGMDAAAPCLADGRVVYQQGADLRLYDIARGTDTALDIRLSSDLDQQREKWISNPLDYVTAAHLSHDGDRVALTARGQVFVMPTEKTGRRVEATRRALVRYRQARFLPDGQSVLALSDESGEVEFWKLAANGVGAAERLTTDGHVLRFDGVPSPDGGKIAHYDKDQVLWIYDIAARRQTKVATCTDGDFAGLTWSPDSRWIAWHAPAPNLASVVSLYSLERGGRPGLARGRPPCG